MLEMGAEGEGKTERGHSETGDLPSASALESQVLRFSPFPGGTPFEPPAVAELNAEFADFQILELEGRGGMGAVYRAHQQSLDRTVAIKVLPESLAGTPEVKERFQREARALAQLNHPNIVTIYEFGQAGDHLFFVMEYIRGRNLSSLISSGELSASESIRLVSEICDALAFAHERGIIHRDIKPDNILIDERGKVSVADFGLAKLLEDGADPKYDLTMSQQALGTLFYMAPEQKSPSSGIDHRCDIYSLGVVFYEMLTGEIPAGHFSPPSKLVPVDPAIDSVVQRALKPRPEARYQSVAEFRAELLACSPEETAGDNASSDSDLGQAVSGPRQVTVFFSDIVDFSGLNERLGDREAWTVINENLELQDLIIKDHGGEVRKITGDSIMAVFDAPSTAMIASLEIQKQLSREIRSDGMPGVRIGLHVGEILLQENDRLEIVSRHINRAHRVMEMAGEGQVLASRAVVDAGADFIETVPDEDLEITYFGEHYLKGVGAIELCEITDVKHWKPRPLKAGSKDRQNQTIRGRLELVGYFDAERVGEGDFGVVYKATETGTGEAVAVRVLPPDASGGGGDWNEIETELTGIGEADMEGLASIRKISLDSQPPFLVTDFIRGASISDYLRGRTDSEVAAVFHSLCTTIEKAHGLGFVHGRLKPSKILVDSDGNPSVLDFGFAPSVCKSGGAGAAPPSLGGSAEYLSPEQIRGVPADPRVDIYSLGAVLYEVLTGVPPYSGETVYEILDGHLYRDPGIPAKCNDEVSEGLQRICLKALEKEPGARYGKLEDLAADLDRVVAGERVLTRPSVYDNLLYNRAAKHVDEIRSWEKEGVLSAEEKNSVLSAYDGLLKRGIAAVMESRRLRPSLVAVYVGGWLAVSGAVLWATLYWDDLSSWQRLTIGSVPFLFTGSVAFLMQRIEHFRLLFVTMLVLNIAVPLFAYVWIHEFSIGANPSMEAHDEKMELFTWYESSEDPPIANRQLVLISFISLIASLAIAWFSRTTTHALQAAVVAFLFYSSLLLWAGLKDWIFNDEIAWASLAYLPLLGVAVLSGYVLGKISDRVRQSIPAIGIASFLILAFCIAFPGSAVREWFDIGGAQNLESLRADLEALVDAGGPGEKIAAAEAEIEMAEMNGTQREGSLAHLATSLFGIVAMAAGFRLRSFFTYRAGTPSLLVILAGAASLWGFLFAANLNWPEEWFSVELFGESVPLPAMSLPFASLAVIVAGCWRQLMSLMSLGLAELAASLFFLAGFYFTDSQAWPATILIIGAVWFVGDTWSMTSPRDPGSEGLNREGFGVRHLVAVFARNCGYLEGVNPFRKCGSFGFRLW
jgi:serine/threonine protein kinase